MEKMAFREAIVIQRFEYIGTTEDKQNIGETNLPCDKITGRNAARRQFNGGTKDVRKVQQPPENSGVKEARKFEEKMDRGSFENELRRLDE